MTDAAVARRRRVGILSSSEKITGAKNAQADALLQQLLQRFQTESRRATAELHALCECVSHDLLTLSLEQRCTELDARRRLDPAADYSHEYGAMASMRKYLALAGGGAAGDGGGVAYANRQQAHRIRRLARPDSRSPAVTQAQAAIRRRAVERAVHERRQQQQQRAKTSNGGVAAMLALRRPAQANAGERLAKSGYGLVRPRSNDGRSSGRMVTRTRANWAEAESLDDARNNDTCGGDEEGGDQGGDSSDKDDSKQPGDRGDSAKAAASQSDKVAGGGSSSYGGGRRMQLQTRQGATRATKPVTLTAMKECWQQVQARVKAFCSECEEVTKVRREQEWASEMKFAAGGKGRSWAEHSGALLQAMGDVAAPASTALEVR